MKKFLAVLLVFVMCMTLVLTSCAKKSDNLIEVDPDKPTDNPPTGDDPTVDEQLSSEEQVIAKLVASVTLEGLFDIDTWLDDETVSIPEISVDDVIKQLKGISLETITYVDNTRRGYIGLKDGIIKLKDYTDNTEQYGVIGDDGTVKLLYLDDDGSVVVADEISLIPNIGGMTEIPGIEDIEGMINEYVPEAVREIIEAIKLPAVEKGDLEKVDEYYVFTEAYYGKLVDKVVSTLAALGKAMGEEIADEEIKEVSAGMNAIVAACNLKIGFAVEEENISGVIIAADADLNELRKLADEMFGGNGPEPESKPAVYESDDADQDRAILSFSFTAGNAGVELYASVKTAEVEFINVSFTAKELQEENRKGVELDLDATIAGQKITANAVIAALYSAGEESGFEISVESDLGPYGGENNVKLLCAIDSENKTVNVTFDLYTDMYENSEWIYENDEEIEVTGSGSLNITSGVTVFIDGNISEGSKLLEFKFDSQAVCDEYTVYNDESGMIEPITISEENRLLFNKNISCEGSCVLGDKKLVVNIATEDGEDKMEVRVEIGEISDEYGTVPDAIKNYTPAL